MVKMNKFNGQLVFCPLNILKTDHYKNPCENNK